MSVTYAVSMPAFPSTSVRIGCVGRMRVQPTSDGIGGESTQSRLGKPRIPVSKVRRTSPVGIASGTAYSNRSACLASASRLVVLARVSGLYAPT